MPNLSLNEKCVAYVSRFSLAALDTEQACRDALAQVLEMSDEELGREDIGLLNLLCAVGLPSADPLNIPSSVAALDVLAMHVRREILKGYDRYLANPNPTKGSEAVYKLWAVMHAVRVRVGLEEKYRRATSVEIAGRQFADCSMRATGGPYKNRVNSQTGFIHGLLSRRCLGSCSSSPVLFASIGRRLGFPVKLVLTVQHIFNRWVDEREQFNMDGSMRSIGGDADHHYVNRWRPWRSWELKSTALHRPLTPREELAVFMFNRSICESANLRFEAAMQSCKIAAHLHPDQRAYTHEQSVIAMNHLKRRKRVPPGHTPDVVTVFGAFSTQQIRTIR